MKKFACIFATSISLTFATGAHADAGGKCHFHGNTPAKESVIVGCAMAHKDNLVSKGKLDASWKGVKLNKAETVEGKKMKEWKLSFINPLEKDASKQTLYMFYALTGNLIGANFDGK